MIFNDFTFKFKTIAPEFEDFKTSVDNFNFFRKYLTFEDENLEIIYNVLMMNFANSYTRAETPELFYADLTTILFSNYKKYFKLLDSIEKVYDENTDLTRDESETIIENNTNGSSSNALASSADTPTSFNPDSTFVNDYTNLQSKSEGNSSFQESKSHERKKDFNIVNSINNALKLTGYPLKEIAQDFSPLFIQIDNPTIELIMKQ